MSNKIVEMPPYLNASYEGDDLYTGDQMKEFAATVRKQVCEELAKKIEAMPFGTTGESFAVWIREQA